MERTARHTRSRRAGMRLLALGIALPAIIAGCAGAPRPEECWNEHFREGVEARGRGESDRAEAELLRARDCAEDLGPIDRRLGIVLSELGELYAETGRDTVAEKTLREALFYQELTLAGDPRIAATLERLAAFYRGAGRYDEAVDAMERSLAVRERTESPDTSAVIATLEELAGDLSHLGRYREAIPYLERAVALRDSTASSDPGSEARALGRLAEAHHHLGEDDDMLASLSRSLRLLGLEVTPVDSSLANELRRSGELLEETRKRPPPAKPRTAGPSPARAAPSDDDRSAPDEEGEPVSLELEEDAIRLLRSGLANLEEGRYEEAADDFGASRPHLPRHGEFRDKLVNGYIVLGMEHYSAGRIEAAIAAWEEALEVDPKNEQALFYLTRTRESLKKVKEMGQRK